MPGVQGRQEVWLFDFRASFKILKRMKIKKKILAMSINPSLGFSS
jgi:hypothetical protein